MYVLKKSEFSQKKAGPSMKNMEDDNRDNFNINAMVIMAMFKIS